MRGFAGPIALILLAACGTHAGAPAASVPAPVAGGAGAPPAKVAAAEPVVVPAGSPVEPAPLPPVALVSADSIALELAAADSAADAAALAALDGARLEGATDSEPGPGRGEGGADAVDVVTSWDIDVESYATHQRVQYYLDFFQGPGRERMAIWLARMPRYEAMIRQQLAANGVPEDMVYLALIESGYSNSAVSRARATGMWQFMKGTGRMYGLQVNTYVDDRRDPVKSTAAAARHLSDLQDRFGSIYLAAAAYNAGAGRVSRGLTRLPDDPDAADALDAAEEDSVNNDGEFFRLYDTRYIRRETKDYVPKLIAAALIAKEPARYGFSVPDSVQPFAYDSIVVPSQTGLDVIARLSGASFAEIRELNPQYIRYSTPPGKSAVVRVPVGAGEPTRVAYAELPASKRISYQVHVVRSGETLSGIAQRYRVSQAEIRGANPKIPKSARLRIGQQLVIPTNGYTPEVRAAIAATQGATHGPARGATTYTVRRGDTLSGIAQRYGTTTATLRRLNGLPNNNIRAGQKLRLKPTGKTA